MKSFLLENWGIFITGSNLVSYKVCFTELSTSFLSRQYASLLWGLMGLSSWLHILLFFCHCLQITSEAFLLSWQETQAWNVGWNGNRILINFIVTAKLICVCICVCVCVQRYVRICAFSSICIRACESKSQGNPYWKSTSYTSRQHAFINTES